MHTEQFINYEREMAAAKDCFGRGAFEEARHHLERAHILGQRFVVTHLPVHWWLFKLGRATGDRREITAQLWRLFLAIPDSIFKIAPYGNPGTARVPAYRKMPIPEEVEEMMRRPAPARHEKNRP